MSEPQNVATAAGLFDMSEAAMQDLYNQSLLPPASPGLERPLQEQLDSRTMLAHHAKPAAPECSAAHERHESRVPGRAPSDEAEGGSGRRRSSMARQGQGLVSSLHSDEFTGRHLRPLLPGDYYLHAP